MARREHQTSIPSSTVAKGQYSISNPISLHFGYHPIKTCCLESCVTTGHFPQRCDPFSPSTSGISDDDPQPFPQNEWDKFRHFKDRRLSTLVTSLSNGIASFLLTCPIIVLYFVTNPDAQLVICFILIFALGLSISTSANRDAIFAATAAYSAVLVVFVSGDLANAK